MSKPLEIVDLTCRFADTIALDTVSLRVEAGEFVSVLGPSGCGKSTLLRCIAGLTQAQEGDIRLGSISVADLPPKDRGIAFMFQSYALYPHLSVRENIAAPLVMKDLPRSARWPFVWRLSPSSRRLKTQAYRAVDQMAELLQITPHLDKRPSQLSGGQQQRVALGRALIREPSLFLLDEPLANLDAALRIKTRSELRELQKRSNATTLFVTHDQSEAMAISDKIAVMFEGRVRQVATPDVLYREPVDLDVAKFMSQPHLNILPADLIRASIGEIRSGADIVIGGQPLTAIRGVVAFRPEECHVRSGARPGLPGLPFRVVHAEHAGHDANLFIALVNGRRCVVRIGSDEMGAWPPGRTGILHFDLKRARVFDEADDAPAPSAARHVA